MTSAALFYFGTGFTPVPLLVALAPLPIFWLATRTNAWLTAALAWLALAASTTNSWTLYVDSVDVPIPMAAMIVVGVSTIFAASAVLFRALVLRGHGLLATLAAPAVHVSGWYLASVFSPAGVVGTFATGQADVPVVLQVASLTGAWGVDYLLVLVPAAVAALLTPGVRRPRTAVTAGVLVAATLAFGTTRLLLADDLPAQEVALIGGNATKQWGTDITTEEGQKKLATYIRAIESTKADLTVLPEGAFATTEETLDLLTKPLMDTAKGHHTTIVVGVILNNRHNTATTITGTETVTYSKWHDRGPKIEAGNTLEYVPGTTTGLTVCGDVNFPNPTRAYAAAGTTLMAIPASDEDLNGWQHSRTALLRGVENGVGIAWAAQRGTLLAADAWGRTAASAQTTAETSILTATLPTGTSPTPYTRWGDWFAWLCLTFTIGATLRALVTQRHQKAMSRT